MKIALMLIITGLIAVTFPLNISAACKDRIVAQGPESEALSPTVRIREHRGSLRASLETEVEIKRTRKELLSIIRHTVGPNIGIVDIELVHLK